MYFEMTLFSKGKSVCAYVLCKHLHEYLPSEIKYLWNVKWDRLSEKLSAAYFKYTHSYMGIMGHTL